MQTLLKVLAIGMALLSTLYVVQAAGLVPLTPPTRWGAALDSLLMLGIAGSWWAQAKRRD
jgi:hypothetical protein